MWNFGGFQNNIPASMNLIFLTPETTSTVRLFHSLHPARLDACSIVTRRSSRYVFVFREGIEAAGVERLLPRVIYEPPEIFPEMKIPKIP
jgi:hypothetical protein